MPTRRVADLIFEMGGDEAQKFFDGIVGVVNLISYALHLARVIGIEVPCPVFEVGKDIVDQRELCSDVSLED